MSAHIYRIPNATVETLRATVAAMVGFPCTSFGGAAAWDFDPQRGRENLRPLREVAAPEELAVSGDFGHAFGAQAEVRWRRCDQDSYDLLILGAAADAPAGARPVGEEGGRWTTSEPAGGAILIGGDEGEGVSVVAYHATNGAVQFLSYRKAQP